MSVAQAERNVERMVREVGLGGVSWVRYGDHDDPHSGTHCFVLKRRDPRVHDHSSMEVLLTCRVDMPGQVFNGDRVSGRLAKLYVDGGGWLWYLARKFIQEALSGATPEGE